VRKNGVLDVLRQSTSGVKDHRCSKTCDRRKNEDFLLQTISRHEEKVNKEVNKRAQKLRSRKSSLLKKPKGFKPWSPNVWGALHSRLFRRSPGSPPGSPPRTFTETSPEFCPGSTPRPSSNWPASGRSSPSTTQQDASKCLNVSNEYNGSNADSNPSSFAYLQTRAKKSKTGPPRPLSKLTPISVAPTEQRNFRCNLNDPLFIIYCTYPQTRMWYRTKMLKPGALKPLSPKSVAPNEQRNTRRDRRVSDQSSLSKPVTFSRKIIGAKPSHLRSPIQLFRKETLMTSTKQLWSPAWKSGSNVFKCFRHRKETIRMKLICSEDVELNPGPKLRNPALDGKGDVQVMSYNVRGLNNEPKLRHLLSSLNIGTNPGDKDYLFLIQETFVEKPGKIPFLWRGNFHLTEGLGNSCGCLTLLSSHINIVHKVDLGNRGHVLACQRSDETRVTYIVANIYAPNPNSREKISFFEEVFDKIIELSELYSCDNIIAGGDFNLVFKESECRNRNFSLQEANVARAVTEMYRTCFLTDVWKNQGQFTWRRPSWKWRKS